MHNNAVVVSGMRHARAATGASVSKGMEWFFRSVYVVERRSSRTRSECTGRRSVSTTSYHQSNSHIVVLMLHVHLLTIALNLGDPRSSALHSADMAQAFKYQNFAHFANSLPFSHHRFHRQFVQQAFGPASCWALGSKIAETRFRVAQRETVGTIRAGYA